MKKLIAISSVVLVCAAFVTGCATSMQEHASSKEANGSRLWSQNCARCHNSRPPSSYSDAQWEVAMLHMRVRANLTSVEQKAILEFLQGDGQ